jgi:tetraacyldisaccharide 4'-kinase
MHVSEVWYGESTGAAVARALLAPASWLYSAGWQIYLTTYKLGFKKPKTPHVPVVCIGNLTVGGSGKTPLTIHVAELLMQSGYEVVISCSGYGSPAAEAARFAPDGPLSAKEWGDETAVIRWAIPEAPLIVGRRRVLAAELCRERYPRAVLLLDDGFQHLPLRKHLSIVIDPPTPNHYCLPAGPYREPVRNRKRADLVVPGKMDLHGKITGFLEAKTGKRVGPPRSGWAVCALGRPMAFLESLSRSGVEVVAASLLPDHDPLLAGNLFDSIPEGETIVVTAKDWVKLRERDDLGKRRILVAEYSAWIEPGIDFALWLKGKIDEVSAQRA